jgi:hypothetical protein
MRTALRVAVILCGGFIALAASAASRVAVTRFPRGIMQPVNGAQEHDDFVIANSGPDAANVTVIGTRQFFNVSPSQFVLDPGTSRTITIQPVVTAGGLYDGAVNVFVAGVKDPLVVPVRLFIGSRPSGTVNPQPSANVLVVSPAAGQAHGGSTNVRNNGNVTMQGILTADSPWLVPGETNVISIAPSANAPMPFTVDASQRADADAPLGAAIGLLSMIYLKGTAQNVTIQQTGTVPVVVIDIQKVAVVPSTPAALAAGEKAAFVPAITDLGGFFTDVFLSNRGTTGLSNVRLFYNAAGAAPASSLLANVLQFPSGAAAWFPFAPSSIFNIGNQTGGLQVRNASLGNVSVSAIRGVIPDGVNRYLTAMPTMTSDASIGSGERLLFAGIEKSGTARTDVVLQETAGVAGAYTVDFFDAAGTTLAPNRTGALQSFGTATLSDGAPTGARSARLTNSGVAGSRVTGFAMVTDTATADSWTVVAGSAPDLIVPIPALGGTPSATTFDVWIANGATSPAPVTITTKPEPPHRRAVNTLPAAQTATLAAGETRKFPITSAQLGYVRINAPAGTISAAGRLTSTVPGRSGAFGTGVPALPSITGAGSGTVKRFSRAADVPNASPPTLLLIESSGKAATARVSIHFTFPAGSTVAGQVSASKDYPLAPGQLVTVADVTRAILGPSRDTLGTVYNLVVDVEVVAGEGKVLSFMQSIDGSGDLTFSTD